MSTIRVYASGEVVDRVDGASLVSRGLAEFAKPAKRRKNLSGAAREGQDADNAENEPPTSE